MKRIASRLSGASLFLAAMLVVGGVLTVQSQVEEDEEILMDCALQKSKAVAGYQKKVLIAVNKFGTRAQSTARALSSTEKLIKKVDSATQTLAKKVEQADTKLGGCTSPLLTTSNVQQLAESSVQLILNKLNPDDASIIVGVIGAECGNGFREGIEECDGGDASACSGACGCDCLCLSTGCTPDCAGKVCGDDGCGGSCGSCGSGYSCCGDQTACCVS
jgi:hypothetical protein